MEGDFFSTLLELAGSGRGARARIRRWSVVLLVVSTGIALVGVFLALPWSGPRRVSAAQIEDGYRPYVPHALSSRSRASSYEITGHLLAADAVTTTSCNGARFVTAPIISERPGSRANARVYFVGSEAEFARARERNRFAGRLYWDVDSGARHLLGAKGVTVGDDVYRLESWSGGRASRGREGSAVLSVAFVLALVSLAGLHYARRPAAGPSP